MWKKQTIWLLTMVSLMIVLSVYYLNAPREGDLALFDEQNVDEMTDQTFSSEEIDELLQQADEGLNEEGTEGESTVADLEEYFASVRMEISNQRSMEKERLQSIVASSESTSDEKNQAYEAMKEIETMDNKEGLLEEQLKSLNGYEEVLVRNVSEDNVVITVQSEEMTAEEANDIIQQAKEEFGEVKIDVVYQ
ncbi:SpoIIIAH-like family protein [Gracilibacillus alcaliphilus]|uniref:SpoIIIAH-like family protein n=1 Tax=Gracilibacillus alcaliphilus TaxID=1401441 RepID=UPI0019581F1C|nr:SpoIIIAH-like family protein [Gracilibacillus alcaliphilus]MBM7675062.1 stage III sporulation protein AH [Gracilibacillus alcaliphilus]